ncbi:MAG TPA: MotA/TolQ/ExbB proton channel family protein [Methylomirabilota bacterium]|nr:MotA/TolQ/ExbB proton channel family protein [Methylomirabilota bacterium]
METVPLLPFLANALSFALEKATLEGKITIGMLVIVSLFSWTVMINKGRQLYRASKMSKKFFAAYRSTRDPMEIFNKNQEFVGAPAYEVYYTGAEELAYHLKNNPVEVVQHRQGGLVKGAETDHLARKVVTKISPASFESVKVALERAVSAQAISLEKGMIILTTAVAGGPFIGLLGTVWGVMETFSGIAVKQAASLTAMAPGVAGALIATVVGLFVAIPAMFAYNYMVTTIRAITQELDNFTAEYATAVEHIYVDNRSVSEEIAAALEKMREREKQPEPDLV